ncbi:YjgN family protein [Citrobacter sp. BDA59-3]|uniref:YjgN family protein n=1 Tax=Citrobacter sp. BDA59-3 TaxID=2781952 RepID=UPI001880B3F9|nr:DUF898 family protein [Citrobacter sp. BDA59-3]QOV69337.1 DUF898 family protein [Citrobacter sp. BDA59-3]
MNGDIRYKNNCRQTFIFHGKGVDYFLISLVNVLLSVITLGIYIPWAMVRSRRYVYENMELNGARFGYHAKGGALFLSWLLMSIFLFILIIVAELLHPLMGSLVIFLLMLVMPFFMVKSLQYNALMTTLNNVRFAFHCSMKNAWWIIMGLPTLLLILLCVVIYGLGNMMFSGYDFDGLLVKVIILALIGIVGMSATNGYVYAKWLSLIGKGGQFGVHEFDIRVSTTYCIKACLFSLCILVPFLGLMFYLLSTSYSSMAMLRGINGSGDDVLSGFPGQILLCYMLYLGAILLSSAYIWQAFRNHFVNGLTLADGCIRFASTLTFYGVVVQLVMLVFVSGITLGLAYPWMKIRFIRYQALHTHVEGDLDDVVLTDHDERVEKGFIALLSRGVMPIAPFI